MKTEHEATCLTLSQLMGRWNCSRRTIMTAIKSGKLQVFRIAGPRAAYRVTLAEVERFEQAKTEAA